MAEEKTEALAKNSLTPEELNLMLSQGSEVDLEEQKDLHEATGMGKINVKTFSPGFLMECIIIGQHRANGYWPKGFAGGGDPPDCAAPTGMFGTGIVDGQATLDRPCVTCPKNQWGSAGDGKKGKACQNKRVIYVIRKVDGVFNPYPEAIMVPATILKTAARYLQETMGTPRWTFITNIMVTDGPTGMGGFAFERGSDLPSAELPKIGMLVREYENARIESMSGNDNPEAHDQNVAAGLADAEL